MQIYKQEKSLESYLLADNKSTASLIVPVKIAEEKGDLLIENLESIKRDPKIDRSVSRALAKIATYEHPDLMYASAILVSTVKNKNDDVFLAEDTWAARNSAINIPYNDDHIESDIIGHTIAARVLDADGNIINSDKAPDYFDIEIDLVMYRGIFPAIAQEILEKAPIGQKFVSMEAKFNDFDYGLVDSKGKMQVIARNLDTAFLTKYLRAYGGEGVYQEYRIARVLRDFRFSGVGNVDTPANPSSEYTRFDDYELSTYSKIKKESSIVVHYTKGKIMTKKIETLEDAQQVIAELTEKLSKFEGKETEELANKVSALETEKQTLTDSLNTEKGKLSVAEQKVNDLTTQVQGLETQVQTLTSERDTKAQELEKIQKEAKANERVAQLKELGIDVNDEKRKEVTEWSDQTFAAVVEYTKSVKPQQKQEETPDQAAAAAAAKANATLNGAKAEEEADVTQSGGDQVSEQEKTEKTAAKLVETLRKIRKNGPKSKKTE